MNEIKCPHCGQAFTVDEAGYSAIVSQVRTKEFEDEISKRTSELEEHLKNAHQKEQEIAVRDAVSKKEDEINKLKLESQNAVSQKDAEIERLQLKLESAEKNQASETESEVQKAVSTKLQEINDLKLQLEQSKSQLDSAIKDKENEIEQLRWEMENAEKAHADKTSIKVNEATAELKSQLQDSQNALANSIKDKNTQLEQLRMEMQMKTNEAVKQKEQIIHEKENEIARLSSDLKNKDTEKNLAVVKAVTEVEKERDAMKAKYDAEISAQKELVAYYKDFRRKQTVKAVGESLEVYCATQFQKIEGYFPPGRVSFEKDNNAIKTAGAKKGSKGDFIYRETDEYGRTLLSIMFEMKNESEDTTSKHKNSDFLEKLDTDRNLKECEYAVLVTMLESDNDYYNQGIVTPLDPKFRDKKMYIVRPEFFLTIISVLRNVAFNAVELRQQVEMMKTQGLDIVNFQNRLNIFKDNFTKNWETAHDSFDASIKEIDGTIKKLQKVKENLIATMTSFGNAEDNIKELSLSVKESTPSKTLQLSDTDDSDDAETWNRRK